jgi:hypothetical protein
MTSSLWAADPHEYGPGKIHIVDDVDSGRTMCGKWLKAVPGQLRKTGRATCKICLNAVENRAHRKVMDEEWRQAEERRSKERADQSRDWWAQYNAYLRSPEWKEKRGHVMRRSGGMCEGCGARRATQVHHLSYEHVCEEFLWELRAVCDVCHDRIHSDSARRARA